MMAPAEMSIVTSLTLRASNRRLCNPAGAPPSWLAAGIQSHLRGGTLWNLAKTLPNSKTRAIWTYERLCARLDDYINKVYHQNHHGTLGMSPQEAMACGLRTAGARRTPPLRTTASFWF